MMRNRGIKLIALDLDGTCLNADGRLSERTKNVLSLVGKAGIIIVIATGRPLMGVPEEIYKIEGVQYIIALNGSRIFDVHNKKTVFIQEIDEKCLLEIPYIVKKYDVLADFFSDNKGYCEKRVYEKAGHYFEDKSFCEYYLKTRIPVDNLWDRHLYDYAPIEKINMFFRDNIEKEHVRKEMQGFKTIKICSGMENNLEINHYMVDKGKALIRIANMLNVDINDIMSFGDGGNDIEMLRISGVGVAMGNARYIVKKEADYITGSNEEDGVAKVLERLLGICGYYNDFKIERV